MTSPTFYSVETCPKCHGTGSEASGLCHCGDSISHDPFEAGHQPVEMEKVCDKCGGSGLLKAISEEMAERIREKRAQIDALIGNPWPLNKPQPPPLPDDAEVFRASGDYVCETCGKKLYDHEHFAYQPSGHGGPVKGCDGIYYHL